MNKDSDALILIEFRNMLQLSLAMPWPDSQRMAFAQAHAPAYVKRLVVNMGHSTADAISLLRDVAVDLHKQINKVT